MSEHASAAQVKAPVGTAPGHGITLQRRCACGTHTAGGAACAVCITNGARLQRKLAIGTTGDPLEREADRVADWVTETPTRSRPGAAFLDIQPFSGHSRGWTEGAPDSVNRVLSNPGMSLEPMLKQDMERRFGYDFSGVRVHTGALAAQSAQDINAQAYTVGRDVVFGAGEFAPGTHAGRRLIAHELTHVVQQGRNGAHAIRSAIAACIVQRAPGRRGSAGQISPPGEGWDGMQGLPLPRELTPQMKDTVTKFRTMLEATRNNQSRWARDAGTVTAKFAGTAAERAVLYGELQRQMMQVDRNWVARHGRGADGSHVFLSAVGVFFIVNTDGTCATGLIKDVKGPIGGLVVRADALRPITGTPAQPTPAPVTPQARTASGEITVPQRGSSTPSGGTPRPVTATAGEIVTPTGGRPLTEGRGGPVGPISVPEPALRANALKGTAEGAVAIINAGLLKALRSAEVKKALHRLIELAPEIEKYREQGYGVAVTLVVEVPDQVDIAAIWAGIGDAGQVVYFRKMYIGQVIKPSAVASTQTTIRPNLAPGDPDQQDPHELTLQQQIKTQMGEKYPVPGTGPRKGFHFASRDLYLPAYTKDAGVPRQTGPGASQLNGIIGTYQPKFEQLFIGALTIVPLMLARRLQVEQDSGGKLLPRMSQAGSTPYSYEAYAVHPPMVMSGRFALGQGRPPEAVWVWSNMEYPRKGLILEWAKGMDSGLNTTWDALFSWRHN